jgi:hypothetical protein
VFHQVSIEVHAAARSGAAGNREYYGAVRISQHHVVYIGCTGQIPGSERHLSHRFHKAGRIYLFDVYMLYRRLQIIRFVQVITFLEPAKLNGGIDFNIRISR